MKRKIGLAILCMVLAAGRISAVCSTARAADDQSGETNWNRAQQLYQKSQSGQALTPEENAYLERAKEVRRKNAMKAPSYAPAVTAPASAEQGQIDWEYARQLMQKFRSGQTLTAEETAYLDKARRAKGQAGMQKGPAAASNPTTSTGLIPLDEMTAKARYKGEDGGLYGGGENVPPASQQQAARKELAKIVPLDAEGKPAKDGKIVLLSIGMSNTTQEFSKFKELADKNPDKSPLVVVVDGAQGGQDAARWSEKGSPATWETADQRLKAAGVTAQQVQAVWMKHARINPAAYGAFPAHGEELKGHIVSSLNLARKRYPNLRIAYLSSRIYAGYAMTPLNPEPYAYESAFVVRRLILDQIKGEPKLNYDPSRGEVVAPLLLWGPSLWADGLKPRKSDGLIWKREDLAGDGTHPSPASGRLKVAQLLLTFFKTDPNARGWFLKSSAEK